MSIYFLLRHTRTLFKESSNRLSEDWYRHINVSFYLGKELCKHTQSLLKTNVTQAYLKQNGSERVELSDVYSSLSFLFSYLLGNGLQKNWEIQSENELNLAQTSLQGALKLHSSLPAETIITLQHYDSDNRLLFNFFQINNKISYNSQLIETITCDRNHFYQKRTWQSINCRILLRNLPHKLLKSLQSQHWLGVYMASIDCH